MDIKKANKIIYDYMEDDCCMCLVNTICPSPSSHHEYCLNEECKKKITDLTWNPYAYNLDSLVKVWKKIADDYFFYGDNLSMSLGIFEFGNRNIFKIAIDDLCTESTENNLSIQDQACISTAKMIVKLKQEL